MNAGKMLKGHDLFQSLTSEDVAKISSFSSVKSLEAGERIYRCADPASHTFVLLEGTIRLALCETERDVSIPISTVHKGDLFGVAPLLGSQRYTTSAFCPEKASVLAIEAKPLMAVLKAYPEVERGVMRAVAKAYFERYLKTMGRLRTVLTEILSED